MHGSTYWKLYSRIITRENPDGGGGGGTDQDAGDQVAAGDGSDSTGAADDGGSPAAAEPTYEELTAQAKELADKAEALRVSKLTDEEKAAEEQAKKDAEAAQANDKAPDEYADFKVPEGMPVDADLLNDFKPVAKELGLSQDKAQKLIDLYAGKVAPMMAQRQAEAWGKQLEAWASECKADKEIGGDKYDAAVEDAKRVVNTLGTSELKKVFDDYGLGNNPELVRVFSRMAKYLKEDTFVDGQPVSGKSMAAKFYPNMNT